MAIDRYLDVHKLLASELNGFLQAQTPKGRAIRSFALTIDDIAAENYQTAGESFRGFVFPDLPKWERLTRGKKLATYPFVVLLFERHPDSVPDLDWVDRRVTIADAVMTKFGDEAKPLEANPFGLRTSEAEYTVFVDQDELRNEFAFWTEISLTYQEAVRV